MHSMYYFCTFHVVEIFSCVFHHQIDTLGNLVVDKMKRDELKFCSEAIKEAKSISNVIQVYLICTPITHIIKCTNVNLDTMSSEFDVYAL